jgi:hypothetical protein
MPEDIEEETTVGRATDTENAINCIRTLIKTVIILIFTSLYVKAAKKIQMLQQNSQMPLKISFPLK